MRSVATHSPSNVAALDAADPNAGGANHLYGIQSGDLVRLQFQHGPRGEEESTPGIFDDDLLAIIEDRLASFQAGPFACEENQQALCAVRTARAALGLRAAARMAQGVLGRNEKHVSEAPKLKQPLPEAGEIQCLLPTAGEIQRLLTTVGKIQWSPEGTP